MFNSRRPEPYGVISPPSSDTLASNTRSTNLYSHTGELEDEMRHSSHHSSRRYDLTSTNTREGGGHQRRQPARDGLSGSGRTGDGSGLHEGDGDDQAGANFNRPQWATLHQAVQRLLATVEEHHQSERNSARRRDDRQRQWMEDMQRHLAEHTRARQSAIDRLAQQSSLDMQDIQRMWQTVLERQHRLGEIVQRNSQIVEAYAEILQQYGDQLQLQDSALERAHTMMSTLAAGCKTSRPPEGQACEGGWGQAGLHGDFDREEEREGNAGPREEPGDSGAREPGRVLRQPSSEEPLHVPAANAAAVETSTDDVDEVLPKVTIAEPVAQPSEDFAEESAGASIGAFLDESVDVASDDVVNESVPATIRGAVDESVETSTRTSAGGVIHDDIEATTDDVVDEPGTGTISGGVDDSAKKTIGNIAEKSVEATIDDAAGKSTGASPGSVLDDAVQPTGAGPAEELGEGRGEKPRAGAAFGNGPNKRAMQQQNGTTAAAAHLEDVVAPAEDSGSNPTDESSAPHLRGPSREITLESLVSKEGQSSSSTLPTARPEDIFQKTGSEKSQGAGISHAARNFVWQPQQPIVFSDNPSPKGVARASAMPIPPDRPDVTVDSSPSHSAPRGALQSGSSRTTGIPRGSTEQGAKSPSVREKKSAKADRSTTATEKQEQEWHATQQSETAQQPSARELRAWKRAEQKRRDEELNSRTPMPPSI